MSEKRRTVILLCLLVIGITFLWLLNREVDANFVHQL